jgi:hypothetical protein
MQKIHEDVGFAVDDFPKDAVSMVAQMAADPTINPRATGKFKSIAQEMRSAPAACPGAATR